MQEHQETVADELNSAVDDPLEAAVVYGAKLADKLADTLDPVMLLNLGWVPCWKLWELKWRILL